MTYYDLATVSSEPIPEPPVLIVYAQPGEGKTHFAASAPAPFFLDIEGSSKRFTVSKVQIQATDEEVKQGITSYDKFDNWLSAIETQDHTHKTLVIDTIDWLEHVIWEQVCKNTGAHDISDKNNAGTAYGNGHIKAVNLLEGIRVRLENLRKNKRMTIILLCHSHVRKIDEPDGAAYDKYTLKTHEKFAALLIEWADAVLFLKKKTFINKAGKAEEGARVLISCGTKAAIAKNRLELPREFPCTWNDFINAIGTNKED